MAYRCDGRSRPAYEPATMVALWLYGYARGMRASRVIERACIEDVAFRVVAAHQRPDHATISRGSSSATIPRWRGCSVRC
jgi:transposase